MHRLEDLLHDKRVQEQIHKHLWIESQKAGFSIGWERAAEDRLRRHAPVWMKHHWPEEYIRWQNNMKRLSRRKKRNKGSKV